MLVISGRAQMRPLLSISVLQLMGTLMWFQHQSLICTLVTRHCWDLVAHCWIRIKFNHLQDPLKPQLISFSSWIWMISGARTFMNMGVTTTFLHPTGTMRWHTQGWYQCALTISISFYLCPKALGSRQHSTLALDHLLLIVEWLDNRDDHVCQSSVWRA